MRIVLGNISVISIYFAGFFFLILSKEVYLFIYYKIYFCQLKFGWHGYCLCLLLSCSKTAGCCNVEGGSSTYGGVIPRSRSSSGQALYMGLNGDSYQRSTSMDDGSGQVSNGYSYLSSIAHHQPVPIG